jgi:hypothetical protein
MLRIWTLLLLLCAVACEGPATSTSTPDAVTDTAVTGDATDAASDSADVAVDSAATDGSAVADGDAVLGDADPSDADPTDAGPVDAAAGDADGDAAADGSGDGTGASDATNSDAAGDTWSPPDGWQPGQMCSDSGDLCPAGQFCYLWPCKKCGAKPQGQCLPDLPAGGCYDWQQCGGGSCVGADLAVAKPGVCLPSPSAGKCWPEASAPLPQCLGNAPCQGATVCPVTGGCAASQPGSCSADAQHQGQVWLWARNGGLLLPGEQVTVTWVNHTSQPVFLAGCSTYAIETRKNGGPWKDLGPAVVCVWEGNAIEVAPGAYFDTHVWTAPADLDGSEYRLTGTWASGCQSGLPLSKAQCSATATATSAVLSVGIPP